MSKKRSKAHKSDSLPERTIDEVSELVQKALVQLDAIIVSAGVIIELSQAENNSMPWKTVMQRYNALEFLIQQAAQAEDQIWRAIDCRIVGAREG